jgi:hypothetical protein
MEERSNLAKACAINLLYFGHFVIIFGQKRSTVAVAVMKGVANLIDPEAS